jgi:flagellar biosynthesis anti-sigma factor FlgM
MRIESTTIAPVTNDVRDGKPASTAQSAPSSPAPTTTPAAVVTLSPAGASASSASSYIKEIPDPKVQARLAHIRDQIQSGAYPIDLDALASRIADDEQLRGVD